MDRMRQAFDDFMSALEDKDGDAAFDAFQEAVRCCVEPDGDEPSDDDGEMPPAPMGKHKPGIVIELGGKRG